MTCDRETLLALAERCKKAEGADRDLMTEAFDACFQRTEVSRPGTVVWTRQWLRFQQLRNAEAWIDAAMIMVPEECLFTARTVWDRGNMGGFASVSRYELAEPGNMLKRYWVDEHQAIAGTPALALTVACLRARAASLPVSGEVGG